MVVLMATAGLCLQPSTSKPAEVAPVTRQIHGISLPFGSRVEKAPPRALTLCRLTVR